MEDNIKIIQEDNSRKDSSISKLKAKDKFNIYSPNGSNGYIFSNFNEIKTQVSNSNSKNKQEKIRNPGVDIIRIIGMYGIIINHLLFLYDKGAMVKYFKYSKYLKIMHILSFWHNNGFALISGIVGYNSFKYSNLLYLWFDVLFYSVSINIYFKIFNRGSYIKSDLSKDLFPIIFHRYWYFSAYFGMYLFLPSINLGISNLKKNDFRLMIITMLFLFVFWRDFKNPNEDVFNMNGGFSLIWLLTYYLTGAYISRYRHIYSGIKKYIYCLICLLIYLISTYLFFFVYNYDLYPENKYYQKKIISFLKQILTERYDSILKVIQSITMCLIFLQITYNKYINKIICFLGPLVFGIYLIHNNILVKKNIISHSFDNESEKISLNSVFLLILFKAMKIFVFCIIIDYFRNIIFIFLRIRRICIIFEIIMRKIF